MSVKKNSTGFTIVELLIATAVFSVILMGATLALIQVSRMYYKGVVSARTQEVARNITDSVSRPIQLQGASLRPPLPAASIGTYPVGVRCIGNQRFTYVIGMQVDPAIASGTISGDRIRHALWRDTLSQEHPCEAVDLKNANPSLGTNGTAGEDLLTQKMRLKTFDVSLPVLDMWTIRAGVFYGDRDLMNPTDTTLPPVSCRGNMVGGQWCAFAEYETRVMARM